MLASSVFKMRPEKYEYPYEEPISEGFRVFIEDLEIPVYTCRISKDPFNRPWPGFERTLDQTTGASYINLVGDEEVQLKVISNTSFEKAWVKPYSKEVSCNQDGNTLNITLKNNGQFVLQCDDHRHMLYIFYSKPIAAPEEKSVTHYFGPGIHFPGKITLHSNESVYIDKDALVFGNIFAKNSHNIRIFGNGILDDRMEYRVNPHCYEESVIGNMRFYHCSNISVEGIGMKDATNWCVSYFGCTDIIMNDIKIFGQWRYNNDGIDIVNSSRVEIKDSFIHSFDDSISIKGIERFYGMDCCDIRVERCVLWCDWGKCCELGAETICRFFRDISFVDCDILRGGCGALDIANRDCAEISNVLFENIRIEFNSFDTAEVLQKNDADKYPDAPGFGIPYLILFQNYCWRLHRSSPKEAPDVPSGGYSIPDELDLTGVRSRSIHDVTVRDIHVYYSDGLPLHNGKPIINSIIAAQDDTDPYYNICIDAIYINGRKTDIKDTNAEIRNVRL